jgi:hypothetical protein
LLIDRNRSDSLKGGSKDKDREVESGSRKSKKVNIVLVGPGQPKYGVSTITIKDPRLPTGGPVYKETVKTTPRLLQQEQNHKLDGKSQGDRSVDLKKKYGDTASADKRHHEAGQQKLTNVPNDNSFEIYGIKKPIKAYDSPDFFKKVRPTFNIESKKNP